MKGASSSTMGFLKRIGPLGFAGAAPLAAM